MLAAGTTPAQFYSELSVDAKYNAVVTKINSMPFQSRLKQLPEPQLMKHLALAQLLYKLRRLPFE